MRTDRTARYRDCKNQLIFDGADAPRDPWWRGGGGEPRDWSTWLSLKHAAHVLIALSGLLTAPSFSLGHAWNECEVALSNPRLASNANWSNCQVSRLQKSADFRWCWCTKRPPKPPNFPAQTCSSQGWMRTKGWAPRPYLPRTAPKATQKKCQNHREYESSATWCCWGLGKKVPGICSGTGRSVVSIWYAASSKIESTKTVSR